MKIRNLGQIGMITDYDAVDIPPNGWEYLLNLRCWNGSVQPVDGASAFTSWTNTGTELCYAHALIPYVGVGGTYWVYAYDDDGDGQAEAIYYYNGSTDTEITRDSGATPYTPAATDNWNVCYYNNIVILNNGVDVPQYWAGTGDCDDLPYASGAAWGNFDTNDSGGTNTYLAKVIRAYKGMLIALNITEAGTNYPTMIHWSDIADPGELPGWDYRDATSLSGRSMLSDTSGVALDAVQLRDVLVLYKTDAIYTASLINAQFVLNIRPISTQYGLWTTNCAVDIGGLHVCLGDGRIYTFDGTTVKDILSGRVAKEFFSKIDPDYYHRAFVTHYQKYSEVMFCYPSVGSIWADYALVWNYKDNTWYYRTIPPCSMMATGMVTTPAFPLTYNTAGSITYNSAGGQTYNIEEFSPIGDTLVAASAQLKQFDSGVTEDPILGRRSNLLPNTADDWVMTKVVKPLATGAAFNFELGKQYYLDGPITWEPVQVFDPGVTRRLFYRSTSPVKAVRISQQTTGFSWTLSGIDTEDAPAGQR